MLHSPLSVMFVTPLDEVYVSSGCHYEVSIGLDFQLAATSVQFRRVCLLALISA
jgi:hypothetical protein